jgi:hypothetical protein
VARVVTTNSRREKSLLVTRLFASSCMVVLLRANR